MIVIGDYDMHKKLLLILTMISIVVLAGCAKTTSPINPGTDYGSIQKQCETLSGKWLDDSKECENISEKDCTSLDGIFSECESACRNDPKAEVCTMQCVIVCKFK